jgi:methylenetetrahydrofolate dehydrogenase (NADP+)/methenyltetrahydrofolate cyclohydrolase/formyltetrahydrofolate synthetase
LFDRSISESELLQKLDALNADPAVHGIIVQMPLDSDEKIDAHKVTNRVSADKDVDGLTSVNTGRVATGDLSSGFVPCTPNGCMELIRRSGVEIAGKNAVVVGKGGIKESEKETR